MKSSSLSAADQALGFLQGLLGSRACDSFRGIWSGAEVNTVIR